MKQSIHISPAGDTVRLAVTGGYLAIATGTEPGAVTFVSGLDLTTLAEAVIDAAGPDLHAHLVEYAGSQP